MCDSRVLARRGNEQEVRTTDRSSLSRHRFSAIPKYNILFYRSFSVFLFISPHYFTCPIVQLLPRRDVFDRTPEVATDRRTLRAMTADTASAKAPETTTTTTTTKCDEEQGSPESVLKTVDGVVKPKRIERLPRPDREAHDAEIAALVAITDEKQARIVEIKALVNAARERRTTSSTANAPLLEKVKALNAIANEKIAQRDEVRAELAANDERRDRVREEANAMRAQSKFLTNESIDQEIARIDGKLAHETMPLAQEKKLVDQIKSLNKSRDLVREYAEKQALITAHDARRKACMDRIKAKDAEINSIKAEQAKIRAQLNEVKSKDDTANADVPKLIEEKNAAYEVIKAKREEINRLRAKQKKIEDNYWAREKLFRAQQKEIKQAQWEASQEERKARDEERKQWEKENAPEPFEDEVSACDALLAYLAKWDTKKVDVSAVKTTQLSRRNEDDEDDMFAVSTAYKKKSKKSNGKSAPSGNERIQHSLDTLTFFSKVKIAVVAKVSDVPASLDVIKAKKEEFLERRKIKKERIAAGLEDEDEKEKEEKAEKGKEKSQKADGKKSGGKGKKKGGKKATRGLSVSLVANENEQSVEVCVTFNDEGK